MWISLLVFALCGCWQIIRIFLIYTTSAGEEYWLNFWLVSLYRWESMKLCNLFYSEQIRSFKATERSHSPQVKPNATLHCGLLTFVCITSLLLNFCIIILKCFECYRKKQGTTATSISGLKSQSTNKNPPTAKNPSQHPEAVASGWS